MIPILLMPGLIAMYIDRIITANHKDNNSNYEWIFSALFFNIPAFTLTWLLIWLANKVFVECGISKSWKLSSFSVLMGKLDSLKFVFFYIVVSLLVGIIVGYFIALQRKKGSLLFRFLNWLRKSQDKSDLLGAPSPWDKLFNNRKEPVIEIIKNDGESVKGFLKDFSLGDEPRELVLGDFDVVEKWHKYLERVKSVYYHLDSNTLIRIYDKTEYIDTLKKMGHLKED